MKMSLLKVKNTTRGGSYFGEYDLTEKKYVVFVVFVVTIVI